MFEKVNPSHPDKVADRIAGALVDLAYLKGAVEGKGPTIAVEVLIGHGHAAVYIETNLVGISEQHVRDTVNRLCPDVKSFDIVITQQDPHLAENQERGLRCGDNGIFRGVPLTKEQRELSEIARKIYKEHPTDGKYILDASKLIICQSNAKTDDLRKEYPEAIINPLGDWTGGTNVDCGATNRKLGSDMADSVTGGGLHGKDLTKADVSVNIYAFLKAQETGETVELSCAIGDTTIDGKPYEEIVDIAGKYIAGLGGFERFAEWGLV